jgi:hypothetical protein
LVSFRLLGLRFSLRLSTLFSLLLVCCSDFCFLSLDVSRSDFLGRLGLILRSFFGLEGFGREGFGREGLEGLEGAGLEGFGREGFEGLEGFGRAGLEGLFGRPPPLRRAISFPPCIG